MYKINNINNIRRIMNVSKWQSKLPTFNLQQLLPGQNTCLRMQCPNMFDTLVAPYWFLAARSMNQLSVPR